MLSRTYRMPALLIAASLLTASGCAPKVETLPIFPPVADLAVEPKPLLDPAALESEAALDRYEIELELHGDRGWQQVGRLCRYFEERSMPGLSCPPPPRRPDPG